MPCRVDIARVSSKLKNKKGSSPPTPSPAHPRLLLLSRSSWRVKGFVQTLTHRLLQLATSPLPQNDQWWNTARTWAPCVGVFVCGVVLGWTGFAYLILPPVLLCSSWASEFWTFPVRLCPGEKQKKKNPLNYAELDIKHTRWSDSSAYRGAMLQDSSVSLPAVNKQH